MLSTRFTVGDTLSFTDALSEYPASAGWLLKYRLIPRVSGSAITWTASASGDDHVSLVAAATTAGWTAGAYSWVSWVESAGYSITIATGSIDLLPDARVVAAPLDTRTTAEVALANVRATLQGIASTNTLSYTINGRQLSHYSVEELLKLEAKLVADVQREQRVADIADGKFDRRKVYVRLARA